MESRGSYLHPENERYHHKKGNGTVLNSKFTTRRCSVDLCKKKTQ